VSFGVKITTTARDLDSSLKIAAKRDDFGVQPLTNLGKNNKTASHPMRVGAGG
jgi:hypothetical protein